MSNENSIADAIVTMQETQLGVSEAGREASTTQALAETNEPQIENAEGIPASIERDIASVIGITNQMREQFAAEIAAEETAMSKMGALARMKAKLLSLVGGVSESDERNALFSPDVLNSLQGDDLGEAHQKIRDELYGATGGNRKLYDKVVAHLASTRKLVAPAATSQPEMTGEQFVVANAVGIALVEGLHRDFGGDNLEA